MAYQAQLGIPISIFHPVRDVDGAYVTGQASALTLELLGPDRLPASEPVILADFAVGWVRATLTVTRLGLYTLSLTNPGEPTADGLTTSYDIVASAGISSSLQLLTSRDRVRTRLALKNAAGQPILPDESHVFDALIDLLISEVSDEYQDLLGRTFAETAYIEYLDGTWRSSLVLGAGPLVSFTLLESVEYQDDGAGGVTEVRTTIPRHTYVLAGLRAQPRYLGRGRVDLLGCTKFMLGPKRYRATYSAGFDAVPEGIVGVATEDVVFRLMTAQTGHLLSQTLGDGSITYLRPQQMVEMRETRLTPYMLEAA